MAKLYRLVPDTISTIENTGIDNQITEDLFYKLGFISIPNSQYFGFSSKENGIVSEIQDNKMFFFLSPWSCIQGLNFIDDDIYSDIAARILEYEVPDELLNLCDNVFTNYENYQANGKMVPFELLKGDKEIITGMSDDIKKQLEVVTFNNALEIIEELGRNQKNTQIDFTKDELQRIINFINKNRANINDVKYFKSKFITGRSMIITKADTDLLMNKDLLKDEELKTIINKSNGILSKGNYIDYNFDAPNHKYGLILN